MKKIISMLLVVVMCLGICACASEEEKLYEKYEDIIEALEDEDYEDAVEEIYKLYEKSDAKEEENKEEKKAADKYKKGIYGTWYAQIDSEYVAVEIEKKSAKVGEEKYKVEEVSSTANGLEINLMKDDAAVYNISFYEAEGTLSVYVSDNSTEWISSLMSSADYESMEAENEAKREVFYGDWYVKVDDELTTLTFNKDSVTVFGTEYTWVTDYIGETSLDIFVMDGETKKYELCFSEESGSINEFYGDGDYDTSYMGSIYSGSVYTVYEINKDNWTEYFELKEYVTIGKDSFGDPDEMTVTKALVLKDTYGEVNSNLSSVAIEYTKVYDYYTITSDVNAGTYTVGESDGGEPYDNTYTEYMYDWEVKKDENVYGREIHTFYLNEFPEDEVSYMIEFKLDRIAGTIFAKNAD